MTRQQTAEINSVAAVLQELTPLIQDIQSTLEKALEGDEPTAEMPDLAARLGEVGGTLELLDLRGPAVLVREMGALARALADGQVENADTALDRLLRAVFRLPDYLDRIRAGQRDAPLVLLPLVNELRMARGESALAEQLLFMPDIDAEFPLEDVDVETDELHERAKRLRLPFMKAFLGWHRGDDPAGSLSTLGRIAEELAQAAAREGVERFWRAAGGVVASLATGDDQTAINGRRLLIRVERLLSTLARQGEAAQARGMSPDLLRDLLYHLAHVDSDSEAVVSVQRTHRLAALVPGADTAAGFEGPNRDLLEAVGEGIREDLKSVKHAIELFVHSEERKPDALDGLPEQLGRIADTFSMLGLVELHDALARQAELIEKFDPSAGNAEDQLQEMADLLLRADNALLALQSGRPVVSSDGIQVDDDADALAIRRLPDSEYFPLVSALVSASLEDLARVREAIGAYCADPDSGGDALAEVPALLDEVRGALAIVPLDDALPAVDGLHAYIRDELIGRRDQPDDQTQILIADVVAGIEYYLEAVDHDRIGMGYLLESANRAIDALRSGGAPQRYEDDEEVVMDSTAVPQAESTVDAASDTAAHESEAASGPEVAVDAEPDSHAEAAPAAAATDTAQPGTAPDSSASASADVPAPGVDPAASGSSQLPIMGDEVDEEIVEVFIEEALGELEKINENLAKWRQAPDNEDALIIVRRAFHTLKGGGRLIGAELIGEFSWSMENLLNRVIDHTVDVNSAVFDTMDEASAALPQLIEQLQGNRAPIDGIDELIARAHALSRGEEPPPDGGGSGGSEPPASPTGGDDEAATGDAGKGGGRAGASATPGDGPQGRDAAPDSEAPWESTDTALQQDGEDDHADSDSDSDPDSGTDADRVDDSGDEPAAATSDEGTEELYDRADLLQIFSDEAEGYCDLLQSEFGEPGWEYGDLAVSEQARRALHTLVGSAQTADVPAIAELAGTLLQLAQRYREQDQVIPAESAELYREAAIRLTQMQVRARDGEEPEVGSILERLRALAPEPEQDAGPASAEEHADPELLAVFLEEADEILEVCDQAMASWREDPADRSAVSDVQRGLHTLKGGARMSHLPAIADLTHEVESVIEAAAGGACELDDNVFELLQEAIDSLTVLVEHVRARKPLSPVDWLAQDLRRLYGAGGRAVEVGEDIAEDAGDKPDQAAGADSADEPTEPAPAAEAPGEVSAAATDTQQRGGTSEQIRVQAELLDNLVNFAGEVSIYHSRLGEQMSQYRFNLNEFQQTVGRVRDQLRTMENETESQILYRHQKEADSPDEDWDPLEFDRYTRIQEVSRSLAESVGDLDSIKEILDNLTRDAETLLLQQSRVSSDLQNGLMQTRMVRFDGLRARLGRVVRQTASALNKKVQLQMTGGELEIDRSVQERVIAPLEHILRNAVSHGIESTDKRLKRHKPEQGTIRLDLHRGGSDIVIEISDDGGGIDPDRVRQKGIAKGLITADDDIDDNGVIKLILETGFSTADEVTQISGRGVGMDVVDSEIRRLGGTLGIQTDLGHGTTFTVRLPVTLAINQAVLVSAGDQEYAIPIASIEGVAQVTAGDLKPYYVDPDKRFAYGGQEYRLRHLGSLLEVSDPRLEDEAISFPVIMVRAGDERVALHVDQLLGRREVVVKPVGAPVNALPAISGATIMADGTVVLILDIGGLLGTEYRFVATGRRDDAELDATDGDVPEEEQAAERAPTVLVVDDSITIRKVTQRILVRNGIEVATAKDGVDAVSWMGENLPDLILLDIEMPRMDGYEVASFVRSDERLSKVPIIMITSRTGQKHRERAEGIGVNHYLGKPYQEGELMEHINALLQETAAA